MKSIKQNLKWAAKILSFLILLQSCTVYHKYTSSVDEAIATNDRVRIDIQNDDSYRFKNIKFFEDEYYGLAKTNSDTYKRLTDRKKLDFEEDKFKYVQLYDEELGEIHLKNKGASTALSIAIPVVLVCGVVVISTAAVLNDGL
jgi:hypothetical protein